MDILRAYASLIYPVIGMFAAAKIGEYFDLPNILVALLAAICAFGGFMLAMILHQDS